MDQTNLKIQTTFFL